MDGAHASDSTTKDRSWSPLSDYARVIRAPLFTTSSDDPCRTYRIVSIRDFPSAGYLPEPARLVYLPPDDRQAEKYVVHPCDVLVTIVGTIGRVTIVPPNCPRNWIPATNIFVVRFFEADERIARTFYGLMKSRFGAQVLYNLAHGSRIQIVSKKQFSRTPIPPFTTELVSLFDDLWNQELDLCTRGRELLEKADHLYDSTPAVAEIVA